MSDDEPARPWATPVSRRAILGGLSLLPLAAALPGVVTRAMASGTSYRFLSAHQASVLDAATRRLVPGPQDDPLELGHPGAHEANVVRYLDTLLSVFDFTPPEVHAGGPWSNRAGGSTDYMAEFVPLNRAQTYAWTQRVASLRKTYADGVALLDSQAGGDFTTASSVQQDQILASSTVAPFTTILFGHTIEAMYGNPEYGGNAGLVGWKDIQFPGDSQPRGYTAAEVEATEIDIVDPEGIVATLVNGGFAAVIRHRGGQVVTK